MGMREEVISILEDSIDMYKLQEVASIKFSPKEKVTYVDYLISKKNDVEKLIGDLDEFFRVNYTPNQKQTKLPKLVGKTTRIKVGEKPPKSIVNFRSYTKSGKLPTEIQEWGSTFVFEMVLRKNKDFSKPEDILNDEDTYNTLRNKIFYNYQDKLDNWIYTYFQQQKQFLKKYKSSEWDEFMYNNDSFVEFFSKYITDKNTGIYTAVTKSGEKKRIKKYTEWNPADIYAAKNMKGIKEQLDIIFRMEKKKVKGAPLSRLNNYLIDLLNKKELVGISLKQIKDNAKAVLELRNTKTTYKDPHIEDKNFKMNDIKFKIDNVHLGSTVSTYIKFGTSFGIDVRSSSSGFENLVFATQISGAAAQGGNAPVAFVNELMRETNANQIKFVNDHNQYPETAADFVSKTFNYTMKDYSTWFKFVKKYFDKPPTEEKFMGHIADLYRKGKVSGGAPAAQTKLMMLHFFYDTLRFHDKNKEFWLTMLYLGMKVGKRYAPHAKIY